MPKFKSKQIRTLSVNYAASMVYLAAGTIWDAFCKHHRKMYAKLIGEDIPREKLEELIFTGGKTDTAVPICKC